MNGKPTGALAEIRIYIEGPVVKILRNTSYSRGGIMAVTAIGRHKNQAHHAAGWHFVEAHRIICGEYVS